MRRGLRRHIRLPSADVCPVESLEAMLKCQNCASHNVRWFTPRRYADRAAVLLCMACRRLTIVPPSACRAAMQAEAQRAA
jgi:hypothetical protein